MTNKATRRVAESRPEGNFDHFTLSAGVTTRDALWVSILLFLLLIGDTNTLNYDRNQGPM